MVISFVACVSPEEKFPEQVVFSHASPPHSYIYVAKACIGVIS